MSRLATKKASHPGAPSLLSEPVCRKGRNRRFTKPRRTQQQKTTKLGILFAWGPVERPILPFIQGSYPDTGSRLRSVSGPHPAGLYSFSLGKKINRTFAGMGKAKITVAGIGPGSPQDLTPAVAEALRQADVVIGYQYYLPFIRPWISPGAECIDTGMLKEEERARQAFERARQGLSVCVVSSGDAGIYGMAPLIWEMHESCGKEIEIEVLPGISAFQKAASLLGAPVGHDFCVISLSDLMTPWERIERRIRAAATADFVTAIYNPKSRGRYWQLHRFREIFLLHRSPSTPVGYVRQAGREGEQVHVTTLGAFDPEVVDMFTVVLVGNSQSVIRDGTFITPRGYACRRKGSEAKGVGQEIMMESFRTIASELRNPDLPTGFKWVLLHTIHTTADFDMERILRVDEGAVEQLYEAFRSGRLRTIVTDVTMAAAGIRKGALERLGVQVRCYLGDERTAALASYEGITRTQAGIRLAAEEHPDALFVFGNAPTALMELCSLIRQGKARPAGIVAAPVGFVHVRESKHMVKPFASVPKIIVEGRKGGSSLAATIVNAILCFDDALHLKPGRDV